MKYKVVKDNGIITACYECCFQDDDNKCVKRGNSLNLQDCLENKCHFELDDTITDVDLKEIDEAMEERK